MNAMTREDVIAILGPIDDELVVEILALNAAREELEEAFLWHNADDALARQLRRPPGGRVAELVEVLEREEEEPDRA